MKRIDKNYFPGWVRKSITFTIDDGKLVMDGKFINIVKPHGIKGTFNVSNFHFEKLDAEGYRNFYRGFEIANHVRLHPYAFADGEEYVLCDEPAPEHAETPNTVYRIKEDGVYTIEKSKGWRNIAGNETYLRLTRENTETIKQVFGTDKIGFAWPFGPQNNEELFEMLKKEGFYGIRAAGSLLDTTSFCIPQDRNAWSFNAVHVQLLDIAKIYEEYPDDGELKTFIFGVHSIDYEKAGQWNDLEKFAKTYGNRPETYWYATNIEIFEYEDAVKGLIVTDTSVENPSDITLYITVDGERIVLAPRSVYNFN